MLLNIGLGDKLVVDQTDELLSEAPEDSNYMPPERIKAAVQWVSQRLIQNHNTRWRSQKKSADHVCHPTLMMPSYRDVSKVRKVT